MAFDPETLGVIVQPIGGQGIRMVSYVTDDDVSVVTGSGYFIGASKYGLRTGDLVFVSASSGAASTYILVMSAFDASGNGTAVLSDEPLLSFAGIAASTFTSATKRIRTDFYSPDYSDQTTLVGGAHYKRMSLSDIASGGYPAASYARSLDRYLPDGTTDAANGGYWLLDEREPEPEMCGAVCGISGGVDVAANSAAIQAAIDYAQIVVTSGVPFASLHFSGGFYRATGLEITRPLAVEFNGARLYSPNGSTAPVITIKCAHDGSDYVASGNLWAQVVLRNGDIKGQDKTDASGVGVAHGLYMDNDATNPIYTRVVLDNMRVNGVAGDGVVAVSGWDGVLEAHNSMILYTGRHGLNANSVADWRWIGGEIAGATDDSILLSGAAEMIFVGANIYSAGRYNINLFGATKAVFTGCRIDLADEHNIWVNLGATGIVDFVGCKVRWGGQATDLTYSDLATSSSAAGVVNLVACTFEDKDSNPFPAPNDKNPLYNIFAHASSTTDIRAVNNVYVAGDIATSGVTNDPGRIRSRLGSAKVGPVTGSGNDLGFGLSGGEVLRMINVASAVNRVEVRGGATGNNVVVKSEGSDGNVGLSLQAKGSHFIYLVSGAQNQALVGYNGDGTSQVRLDGGTASVAASLVPYGSATDLDIRMAAKGAGGIHLGLTSQKVGFLGATPVTRPEVTGAHGSNAALQSLLSALGTLGLITDSSS